MSRFLVGMDTMDRDEFMERIDTGVPVDDSIPGNGRVLLLYSPKALPNSTTDPLANCHNLKVVLTEPKHDYHCLAIAGQWSSYHVHRFMRIPPWNETRWPNKNDNPLNPSAPLRYVGRQQHEDGHTPHVPSTSQSLTYYSVLQAYLAQLPSLLEQVRPLAASASEAHGVVVILVCNWGQSELLANFACSSSTDRASILVFCTDTDTYELATKLGLRAIHVQDAFGDMPTEAARSYGDKRFTGMMLAKVYCVHLVSLLGYDLLFQDVDVVWYDNPLPYLKANTTTDLIFQDDGAHSPRYAPYSPNSGFYFCRHNARTEFFWSTLARAGDEILMTGSHQSVLNTILADQASSRGLTVKILGRYDEQVGDLFPGGFHYHRRKDFMKKLMLGERKPFVFHMSWTKNKDNKQKFFQQMGKWHLKDQCIGPKPSEMDVTDLRAHCCSAEPLFTCHYRDKPSWKPCKQSPPIDKGKPSFW